MLKDKPKVQEIFADNGEHSHFELFDTLTGATLWSESSVKTVKLDAVVIHRLLEQKEAVYNDICAWFETEYDSNTDKDTLAEYEKNAIEIKAQIKLLNYLIYDVKD